MLTHRDAPCLQHRENPELSPAKKIMLSRIMDDVHFLFTKCLHYGVTSIGLRSIDSATLQQLTAMLRYSQAVYGCLYYRSARSID